MPVFARMAILATEIFVLLTKELGVDAMVLVLRKVFAFQGKSLTTIAKNKNDL